MTELSRLEFRRFLLSRQGLWPPRNLKGKEGTLELIRRLRCVQYDSIDIVGRNHEIVLQSRVAGFRRRHLWELLYEDRLIVDGWDKQMSLGPVEERKYFAAGRRELAENGRFREDGPLKDMLFLVREEIRSRGPLCSLDIESDEQTDWSWAPTRAVRAAMEALWFRGEFSIQRREGSRRYYDFTENLLNPDYFDLPPGKKGEVSEDSQNKWRLKRRIDGVGALMAKAGDGWLGLDIQTKERRKFLSQMKDEGLLRELRVEGFPEALYAPVEDSSLLDAATADRRIQAKAAVIAPLDNLIWDRNMIRLAFEFDYVWEVYKPLKDRRWGYYVLPILYGDRFIARFEPGRDRQNQSLIIKNWWTEPDVRPSHSMTHAVRIALKSLATADSLKQIVFLPEALNDSLAEMVSRSLKSDNPVM